MFSLKHTRVLFKRHESFNEKTRVFLMPYVSTLSIGLGEGGFLALKYLEIYCKYQLNLRISTLQSAPRLISSFLFFHLNR